jgi:hypothetical protein
MRRGPHRTASPRLAVEALEDRCVPASLTISDASIVEGNAGTRNALLTVTLTGAGGPTVSVNYSTASGTARAGSDYQATSGTLSFNRNTTSRTILVPIIGDSLIESDESFSVNLTNPKHATIADGQGVVTILNDDTQIRIYDVWQSEGNSGTTAFNFTVSLSTAISQPVTVNYGTVDGSAVAGSDYQAASGSLTIPAGQTSGTITVLVNGDTVSESDENFSVHLSNASTGTIADGQAVGTINDDEPRIRMLGMDVVQEGNSGTTELACTVILTAPSDETVTVDYATVDDLATTADGDYTAASGTLTFAPGVTSQTITLLIHGDLVLEYDEYFYVKLSNPTNAQLIDTWALATIQSDDNAVLHIDSYADVEPDPYSGGETFLYFTVWLSNPFSETVTVDYSTVDNSATAWWDYVPTSGTLTFEPGETSQTIVVEVLLDYEYEWTEDFFVILSNPSSNALFQPGWGLGVGTIYDNQGGGW